MLKDYLSYENDRNHRNHKLYERLMRKAVGADANILVAHHLTFEVGGADPNEIPSADTLMFCHTLMGRAFGEDAHEVMAQLALTPVESRDRNLENFLDLHDRNGSVFAIREEEEEA